MSVRLDHGEDTLDEVHEINVTPFIDVMLVLLIIFMVAAPLATVDIAVNLPASTAEPQPRPERPLYLTVKSDLTLALGEIAETITVQANAQVVETRSLGVGQVFFNGNVNPAGIVNISLPFRQSSTSSAGYGAIAKPLPIVG